MNKNNTIEKEMVNIKNKRIMLICTTDNMIWQFLLPHIKQLQIHGAIVDCICSKTGFWFDELKNKYKLNMIEIPMERKPLRLKNLKAYNLIKNLQKTNNYDLIYCQQPVGGLIGRLIGKKFKIPVVYTAHGFFFYKGNNKIKNMIFHAAEKYLSKYTNILITINDEDYEASKNWKNVSTYIINGIGFDETKYDLEKFNHQEFKKSLGVEENDKIILSVSEFIKRKNYATMLDSFAKLSKFNNDIKYILCGTGTLLNEMKDYAKQLGIDHKTIFLGYRKDINKIMQVSDIFFHQSFHEGLTMGIIEAMHYGLPVVCSDVRGNKDLIHDNLGGYLTDCTDITNQVIVIQKLLDNPSLRTTMGEYNKSIVKQYYLPVVIQQLDNIYRINKLID